MSLMDGDRFFARCCLHRVHVISRVTLEQTYQGAPLVSLCSTGGAAGTGVLLDPQGLALAGVPTSGASLRGEKVPGPWVIEPKR